MRGAFGEKVARRCLLAPGTALLVGVALLFSGCGKKPDAKPAEIRRYQLEVGDKLVRVSGPKAGEEIVLRWRALVKPIEDEVAR